MEARWGRSMNTREWVGSGKRREGCGRLMGAEQGGYVGRVGVNGSSGIGGLTSADVGDAFSILAASSEEAFNNNSNNSCLCGKPLIKH